MNVSYYKKHMVLCIYVVDIDDVSVSQYNNIHFFQTRNSNGFKKK